jgi:hypothetical protein
LKFRVRSLGYRIKEFIFRLVSTSQSGLFGGGGAAPTAVAVMWGGVLHLRRRAGTPRHSAVDGAQHAREGRGSPGPAGGGGARGVGPRLDVSRGAMECQGDSDGTLVRARNELPNCTFPMVCEKLALSPRLRLQVNHAPVHDLHRTR